MSFKFTAENIVLANKEIDKYPKNKEKSAVMALLSIAQKQNNNFLSKEILDYVAQYLNIPVIQVQEVATFYTMYNFNPVGRYHLQVCSNVVCYVRGAQCLLKTIEEATSTKLGSISLDGMFSFSKVECLGACANAPVIQINDDYLEDMDSKKVLQTINLLKNNEKPKISKEVKAPVQLALEINNVTRER